jgi:hypothetical protein
VPLKATGECLEPFDLVLTVEILRVTWHDVWPGNEPGFRLVKIIKEIWRDTRCRAVQRKTLV